MTGKSKIRLVSKKILTFSDFRDYLLNYLTDDQEAAFAANFPIAGFFGTGPTLTSPAVNQITIGGTGGPFLAGDGLGRLLSFINTAFVAVPMPGGMADGTVLGIALERALLDQGVEVNPRTQLVNYGKQTEAIGRRGTPDAVVDNGDGTMTFTLNTITEGGVSYAGRTATVWLKPLEDGGTVGPLSAVEATAIETRTVAYDGANNKITTAGKFGQGVTPSTTASDYVIVLNGPTIRRQITEDLRSTAGAVMIGTTTVTGGNAATGIDTSSQVRLVAEGELMNVLVRGPHGDLKVRVKAHALDSGVSQLSIVRADGTPVVTVDELGHLVGLDGADISGGAGTALVTRQVAGNLNPQYQALTSGAKKRWGVSSHGFPTGDVKVFQEFWDKSTRSRWTDATTAAVINTNNVQAPHDGGGTATDPNLTCLRNGPSASGGMVSGDGTCFWSWSPYMDLVCEFMIKTDTPANSDFIFDLRDNMGGRVDRVRLTSTAGANWVLDTAAPINGGTNTYGLGVAPVANTWQKFVIEYHGAATDIGVAAGGVAVLTVTIDGTVRANLNSGTDPIPDNYGAIASFDITLARHTGSGSPSLFCSPIRAAWNYLPG